MGLLKFILRIHLREKLSIREIARRTGLSRNTVPKHLAADTVEPRFATQAFQNNQDLVFGGEVSPGGPADIFDNMFGRPLAAVRLRVHVGSFVYGENRTLHNSQLQFCAIGADVGQRGIVAQIDEKTGRERRPPPVVADSAGVDVSLAVARLYYRRHWLPSLANRREI